MLRGSWYALCKALAEFACYWVKLSLICRFKISVFLKHGKLKEISGQYGMRALIVEGYLILHFRLNVL